MRDFTLYGGEDGEMKPLYSSTNGKWRCVCCGKALTTDLVAALLVKHSANDEDYFDNKEVTL